MQELGTGISLCKVPEADICLDCPISSKKFSVAGTERMRRTREKLSLDGKEDQGVEGNPGLCKSIGLSLKEMGSHLKVLSNVIQSMLCWDFLFLHPIYAFHNIFLLLCLMNWSGYTQLC